MNHVGQDWRNESLMRLIVILILCLASTALVFATFDAAITVSWLICWTLPWMVGANNSRLGALLLFIGLVVLYPEFSSAFRGVHEKVIVLPVILSVAVLIAGRSGMRQLSGERALLALLLAWMTWSLLAYAPVLFGWVWISILGFPGADWMRTIQHETSGLKTALPVILSPLATVVVMSGLRDRSDFAGLRRGLEYATITLAALSLIEWLRGSHFVPVDVGRLIPDTTRLEGFSTLDSNGLGRLLLFPSLMFLSAVLTIPKVGLRTGLALVSCLSCLLLTQSRTSYISFTIGAIVIAVLNMRKLRLWMVVGVSAVWAGMMFAFTGLGQAFSPGSERMTVTSFKLRIELWHDVVEVIRQSPWFGAHPSGYVGAMQRMGAFDDHVNSAHNLYLALGAEWGIPVIVLAVAVMFVTVVYGLSAFRKLRFDSDEREATALAGASVAVAVSFLFHGISEIVPTIFLFMVAGCAGASVGRCKVLQSRLPER